MTQCTHWTDFLVGVGELACQAEIQHVAASAGTGQSPHGKVGLQFKIVTANNQASNFMMTFAAI